MWIVLSLAAMVLMSLMMLLLNGLNRMGVDQAITLLCSGTILLITNGVYLGAVGTPLRLPAAPLAWVLLIGAGMASFGGNLLFLKAMNCSPNPGYACAIESTRVMLVTLVSIWIFAAHFSLVKGLGVLCCTIGVILICL